MTRAVLLAQLAARAPRRRRACNASGAGRICTAMDKVVASAAAAVAGRGRRRDAAARRLRRHPGLGRELHPGALRDRGPRGLTIDREHARASVRSRRSCSPSAASCASSSRASPSHPTQRRADGRRHQGRADRARARAAGNARRARARGRRRARRVLHADRRRHRRPRAGKEVREFDGRRYVLERGDPRRRRARPRASRRPRTATSSTARLAELQPGDRDRRRARRSPRSTRSSSRARSIPRRSVTPGHLRRPASCGREQPLDVRDAARASRAAAAAVGPGGARATSRPARPPARPDGAQGRAAAAPGRVREPRHGLPTLVVRSPRAGAGDHAPLRERHARLRRRSPAGRGHDIHRYNASGQLVRRLPGASFTRLRERVRDGAQRTASDRSCSAASRSRRTATSRTGTCPPTGVGGIGGAMDLARGRRRASSS